METEIIKPVDESTIVLTPPKTAEMQHPTLDHLEKERVISPEAKSWFIEATDPFHDTAISLAGYPDTNVASSVIQCVKSSLQIQAPASITSGLWDCNCVLWPMVTNPGHSAQWNTTDYNSWTQASTITVAPYTVGGFTCLAGASGSNLYGNATSANITDLSNLSLNSSYLTGSSRILGMGFEVVNTTSKLYVQGQVATWRLPSPSLDQSQVVMLVDGAGVATAQGFLHPQPPSNLAQAMLLSGTKTWKASEGCYVVATMNDVVNRAKQLKPQAFLSVTGDVDVTASSDVGIGSGIDTSGKVYHPVHISPFNMCGAYFTGLSLQTTLQLNVIYYIERFPSPYETDLVVLASPSPGYESLALEMYSKTMSDMPTGVPQGENPLGEWFEGILHSVSKVAEPVLRGLGNVLPGANIGAEIAKGVAKATKAKRVPKKTRKSSGIIGGGKRKPARKQQAPSS